MNTDPSWNRDARSRALTRGVLMALSRKREWYFDVSYFWTVVWSILTLGTWPLLLQAFRFDRFRRLEWNQYHAFAQWLGIANKEPISQLLTQTLITTANDDGQRKSLRLTSRVPVILAVVFLVIVPLKTGDLYSVGKTAFYSPIFFWQSAVYSLILGWGYIKHANRSVLGQHISATVWLAFLNEVLDRNDRRRVLIHHQDWPLSSLFVCAVVGVFIPFWMIVMLVAIAIQNRYTRGTRAVRLAMLERMLEWMDTSGLPVEFDIEEVEPEDMMTAVA